MWILYRKELYRQSAISSCMPKTTPLMIACSGLAAQGAAHAYEPISMCATPCAVLGQTGQRLGLLKLQLGRRHMRSRLEGLLARAAFMLLYWVGGGATVSAQQTVRVGEPCKTHERGIADAPSLAAAARMCQMWRASVLIRLLPVPLTPTQGLPGLISWRRCQR